MKNVNLVEKISRLLVKKQFQNKKKVKKLYVKDEQTRNFQNEIKQ